MADIRLAKPAAGASESVQCAPDARFVFDFPTTDATLARDGDNLNIKFEDGSQLELQGFYQEYNGDNLPSFNIDGTEVAAADFFQAMNEPDLMPAAGPGTGTVANGARFHEWGDSALTGGILHLDGLDWGFSRAFEWDDVPNAVGRNGDDWGLLYSRGEGGSEPGAPAPGNTVPELNTPPAPEPPLDPEHPGDDPGKPVGPGNPGGYVPSANGASIVVDEGALAGGSGQHVLHGASGTGAFVADVHAERGGSIVLTHGGQSLTLAIPEDGATAITVPQGTPHTFTNVNGVDITILGATSDGAGKWTVNYEYTLAGRVEHDKATHDTTLFDARGVAITVTDGSGDVTTGRLTVEVHDDVPQFSVESTGEATSLAGSFGLNFGADAAAATGALTAAGATATAVEGATTHLTFAEGTLSITSEGGNEFSYTFTPSGAYNNLEFSKDITLTATDGDRDTDTTTITVGQEKAPTITTTTGGNVTGGKIIVDEGAMANGTRDHAEHGITGTGSFTVDMHGENGNITVSDGTEQGTVTITIEDGVASGEGTLHVNGVDVEITGATLNDTHWTVNYTYTLTESVTHAGVNAPNDEDTTSGKLMVTATDDDGKQANAVLNVFVHDDGPKLTEVKVSDASKDVKDHSLYIDDAAEETISIELDGMKFGADMEGTDSASNPVVANVVLSVAYDEITKTATFTMQDGKLKRADGDSELNYQGGKFIFTRPEGHYKAGNNQNDEYTFTAKITDSDGDHVEKSVTVSTNHTPDILTPGDDPEPVAKEQEIEGASITVDESGLDNDDYKGTSPAPAKTVDNTHTFKLDTHGEGGTVKFSFLLANKATAGAEYTLGTDDSVEGFAEESFHTDHGVFTITGIKHGVVSYKYELTSPARTEGDNKAESHEAEQIKVTLTDNEHADQTSAYIAVNIKDDMPYLSSHSYSQSLKAGESVTSLNFATHTRNVSSAPTAFNATDGWSDMMPIGIKANDGGIDWEGTDHTYMGSNQGVLIIPTHVVYEYDDAGNFTVGVQNDIHYTMEGVAKNTLLSNKHLALGPNGLTVGTADKVGRVTGFDADEISVFTTGGASEALSFENNDPFYGITIKFGGLEDDYDKAFLAFYLTPKSSNDDRVVKIVEVTADMLDNGTYTAEVPDGFTKLIVSAAPTTAGHETASGFGILSLDFKKNTQKYDGQVEFTAGADGLGAVTWDWSASGLDNAQVEILNIVGGKYKVNLEGDNTVTAKLVALSQDAMKYDGDVLFKGTLDSQTGQWHLTQNYKFQVYKGNEKQDAIFDVTFKVSDGEGDTATLPASIDLSKPMYLDRFDSMDKGFWNDTWGSNNGWKDHAADYILGGEDNSLIYGNGGDDLLFGDGDGALANLKTQLGTTYTFTENLTAVAAERGGPNEAEIRKLWNNVAALSERQLLDLQEAIERDAGSGDDALFGGLGNDLLLGGAGNDYFEGNGKRPADWKSSTDKAKKWESITDVDIILAGSGEDIIVYDANDRLIDGGKGTDILLAGDKEQKLSLKNILSNTGAQKVYRVEVLLKSIKSDHIDKFGIKSHASLLLYGIVLGENGMALDVGVWERVKETEGYLIYRNTANGGPGTLEIQTTLGDDHVQLVAKDELGTMTTDNGGVDTLGLVPEDDGGTEPGSGAQLFAMRPSAPADENEGDAGHAAPAPAAGAAATGGKNLIEGDEDEPNTLVGTDGDDVIIGGSAGDFIDGGAGSDTIYAGAGDDLIVYDATDYLIDGGEGIDFLLSGSADPAHSLADMLGNWAQNGADKGMPMVHDVEVMLKGVDTSLQNMDSLAREYGFSMDKDANGRDILVLDKDKWALDESQSGNGTNTYVNAESGITLETTLTETATGATDAGEHAAQTIVLTSNG